MAVLKAPTKTLYDIKQGFWHRGVYAPTGLKIALTDVEAKNLLTGGNVAVIEPEPAAPETAPAPAQA